MTVHYFAMFRAAPPCTMCPEGFHPCPDCNGTGLLPERLVLHRAGRLYDTPGAASGSAKRAGHDPIVYRLDTDECAPFLGKMSPGEQLEYAEAKYIYWGGRLDGLKKQVEGQPVLLRHDPKLTAEDYRLIRALLVDMVNRANKAPERHDAQAMLVVHDLLTRINTKVQLDELDAQTCRSRDEVARIYAEWAAGKGPRRCMRVGKVDPLGMARTACDDDVPGPASTVNRDEVACHGCQSALARGATP